MTVATVSESFVQHKALQRLNRYYSFRLYRILFSRKEVVTKRKYGSKRADGLIVLRHWLYGGYTVSLEAKSIKTLPAIRPMHSKGLKWKNRFRFWLLSTVIFMVIWPFFDRVGWSNYAGLILVVLGLGFVVFYWFFRHKYKDHAIGVFRQISQYPANEQWLAISKESLKHMSRKNQKILTKNCSYRGIGLILINKYGLSSIIIKPRIKRPFKDYSPHYILD